MKDLNKFKNKIFIYGILIMLVIEVISLPFLGFRIEFLFGIVVGTGIAVVNFNIMTIISVMILEGRNKFLATLSYIIRLLLYSVVFYVFIRISFIAGIAAACGFMTLKIAIGIIYIIIPRFKKDDFDENNLKKVKLQLLIATPHMIGYAAGRRVITHKRFGRYKR